MKKEKHPTLGNMYAFRTKEEKDEAMDKVRPLCEKLGLRVQILSENIMSRGVQGDEGTYTRVFLVSGKNPGWKALEDLSTKMTNFVPINRVLFCDDERNGK